MKDKIEMQSESETARDAVISFIEALNAEDFKAAKKYLAPEMMFEGVLGSRHGADNYLSDMEKMKLKYDIQKIFEDGDDVCLFYNINISGTSIFSSGWYKVQEGKITSFKVIFDPRPLLEKKDKK